MNSNNLYYDFSNLVDFEKLISMKKAISLGIAKNWQYVSPGVYSNLINFEDSTVVGMYDAIPLYKDDVIKNLGEDVFDKLLAQNRLTHYLKYEYDIYYNSMTLGLRWSPKYRTKHLSAESKDSNASKDFDFLYRWIDEQDIFSDYGRVALFINEPGVKTAEHRDSFITQEQPDEFLWISFNDRKPFYIVDKDGQRHYVSSHIIWFDTRLLHGSDPCTNACYTLRVDGVFKNWVKDSINNAKKQNGVGILNK